jgi:hypothetical protein
MRESASRADFRGDRRSSSGASAAQQKSLAAALLSWPPPLSRFDFGPLNDKKG